MVRALYLKGLLCSRTLYVNTWLQAELQVQGADPFNSYKQTKTIQ